MEQGASKQIIMLFDDVANIPDRMVRYVLTSGINAILLHGKNFKDAATIQKIAAVVTKIRTAGSNSLFDRLAKMFNDDNKDNPGDFRLVIGKDMIETDDDIIKLVEEAMNTRERIV